MPSKKPLKSNKRVFTDEQKAKMQAGRDKYFAEKRAAKLAAAQQEQEFEPESVRDARLAGGPVNIPNNLNSQPLQQEQPSSPPLEAPVGFSNEQLMTMMLQMQAEMSALRQQHPAAAAAPIEAKIDELAAMGHNGFETARVGANGMQGIVTRYSIEKSHYPDPSERLLAEKELRRFAMKENYIFRWEVDGVTYNKHNIDYAEPRFTVSLFQILYDDDGEPTGRMALIARQMMHEDKMFCQMAALRLGIADQFGSLDDLMDEIRYQTIKQWLIAIFKPAKVNAFTRKQTTEVINGKVVEVFDTEKELDKESGVDKSATIASQNGVGKIAVPKA